VEGRVVELPDEPGPGLQLISDVLGAGAFGNDDVERYLSDETDALVMSMSWAAPDSATGYYRFYFDVPGRSYVLTGSPNVDDDLAVGNDGQDDPQVFRQRPDVAGYRQHSADEPVLVWSAEASQRGTLNVLFVPASEHADVPPLADPSASRAVLAYVDNHELRWVKDVPLQIIPS